MKLKSSVCRFLSQLKPASNEALFSCSYVCRQNELQLEWFCSHKPSLALRCKRHETSLLMRWYLLCDTTFHPSSCKGFANIDLSFTNPRSWRNVCFRKVGWPGPGEGMKRVVESSWIRAREKTMDFSSWEGWIVPLDRLACVREEDFGKCSSLSWKMDGKSLSIAAQTAKVS